MALSRLSSFQGRSSNASSFHASLLQVFDGAMSMPNAGSDSSALSTSTVHLAVRNKAYGERIELIARSPPELYLFFVVTLRPKPYRLLGGSARLVCTSECPSSVIFRARSRERSQLPLPGCFLSSLWFTLCITMEVEPRIVKEYRRVCENCKGKVVEDGTKCLCIVFTANHKIVRSWGEKCSFGHHIARATSCCSLADTV